MTEYRRPHTPGATWVFTVNLLQRRANSLLVDRIDDLRNSIRHVKATWPFRIDAMVVLSEHLHAIWTLPPGDAWRARYLATAILGAPNSGRG